MNETKNLMQALLSRYENGEINREEFEIEIAELFSEIERKANTESDLSIALYRLVKEWLNKAKNVNAIITDCLNKDEYDVAFQQQINYNTLRQCIMDVCAIVQPLLGSN